MKICVYSDVHSNLQALENLRKTTDYKSADLRIFLGDAIAVCPYPNECVDLILKSGDIWLMGNHDCYLAYGLPKEEYPYFLGDKRKHQSYLRKIVKCEFREKIKNLPKSFEITIRDKSLYFIHYPWENDVLVEDCLEVYTGEHLDKLFSKVDSDYIFFGHEHKEIFVKTSKATYIGVGALGVKHPGNYILITVDENNFSFETKKVNYDLKKLRKEMLEANYPWAKEYTRYIEEE